MATVSFILVSVVARRGRNPSISFGESAMLIVIINFNERNHDSSFS
jgi:hypothetical protein